MILNFGKWAWSRPFFLNIEINGNSDISFNKTKKIKFFFTIEYVFENFKMLGPLFRVPPKEPLVIN